MRRVAIAGVLAMEPDVIVLDEPTAGLDPRGRKEIMDMFYQLHKKEISPPYLLPIAWKMPQNMLIKL